MTEEAIERIEKDVKVIKVAIIGDVNNEDKIGLKGHLALVKASLNRAWWVIAVIVGLLAYVVRSG